MLKIDEISKMLNIPEDELYCYGKYMAKINNSYYEKIKNKSDAKLILVTSINPTPFGEGKTTQSIGLSMAMNKLGKNNIVVLREPSLGPVFGIKGGAVGGGKATVEPQREINLHFTGDFHAITSANNLLCAVIDNHIFQGNSLNIDKDTICIKRVIDMNDRALRKIEIGLADKVENEKRETGFEITAACELMAICDLSTCKEELKNRIDNMLVAYTKDGRAVYAKEFNCTNAMVALLENVLNPNLIQTSENTPCLMHLGPFANIAHGCNSLIATKMAMKMSDYVITEAGFGADLGAEKFFDIKCRIGNLKPDLAMIVVTIKALKYNAGISGNELEIKNIEAIKNGIPNLEKHIENIKKYGVPVVVCINKFANDDNEEISFLKDYLKEKGVDAEVSTSYSDGGEGSKQLSKIVINKLEKTTSNFKYLYSDNLTIKEKIEKVSKEIYGAGDVEYLNDVSFKINEIEKLGYSNLPICIAKTPSSLSDDPKLIGRPKNFSIKVKDIKVNSGAGFIVVYTGDIMTMPGLGKKCKYEEF